MRKTREYKSPTAAMLWSLVLPGFGQLYNKDYFVGIVLMGWELAVNLNSNLNVALLDAFNGDSISTHQTIHYQWAIFYPSVYGFGLWQAFNFARSHNEKAAGMEGNKRTYLTGFFIGMVLGMDFGLFWHDGSFFKKYWMLDSPIFNGILLGLLMGLLGNSIELWVRRKQRHLVKV